MNDPPDQTSSTSDTPASPGGGRASRGRLWLTVLLATVIFLAGAVTGGGLTAVSIFHHALRHFRPDQVPAYITQRLKWKLDLNDRQAARIQAILTRRQDDLQAIRAKIQPQVQKEMQQVRGQIAAVLTDDQQQRWYQLFDQMRDYWKPPHSHWRPHGHGTPMMRPGPPPPPPRGGGPPPPPPHAPPPPPPRGGGPPPPPHPTPPPAR